MSAAYFDTPMTAHPYIVHAKTSPVKPWMQEPKTPTEYEMKSTPHYDPADRAPPETPSDFEDDIAEFLAKHLSDDD
jgi:hypothetical protein